MEASLNENDQNQMTVVDKLLKELKRRCYLTLLSTTFLFYYEQVLCHNWA